MSYLDQAKRQVPKEPTVCITNKGHIILLPDGIRLSVVPVGGGSPPYIRQAYLYTLSIPNTPPGGAQNVSASWVNAVGPTSFSAPGLHTGYLGPTRDGVVGVLLTLQNGNVWGSVFAAPPGHPHPPH